ncbi:OmpA family protein [Hahella ganghwensis]|uniref:OmpA family protein n=1 Tax=Hahella ganghwensis TaxID=286420 RepID=UPI0003789761|nr:OmpA family protein [Hahella ganghwensis]
MQRTLFMALFLGLLAVTNQALAKTNNFEPVSHTVSVSFKDGSSTFHPSQVVATILEAARDADMINISGRTSTLKPSRKDEALALARAVSARNYLVSQGVSPLKIMINYVSAADFIADNGTPEGRYLNQRVDIQMIYVPVY